MLVVLITNCVHRVAPKEPLMSQVDQEFQLLENPIHFEPKKDELSSGSQQQTVMAVQTNKNRSKNKMDIFKKQRVKSKNSLISDDRCENSWKKWKYYPAKLEYSIKVLGFEAGQLTIVKKTNPDNEQRSCLQRRWQIEARIRSQGLFDRIYWVDDQARVLGIGPQWHVFLGWLRIWEKGQKKEVYYRYHNESSQWERWEKKIEGDHIVESKEFWPSPPDCYPLMAVALVIPLWNWSEDRVEVCIADENRLRYFEARQEGWWSFQGRRWRLIRAYEKKDQGFELFPKWQMGLTTQAPWVWTIMEAQLTFGRAQAHLEQVQWEDAAFCHKDEIPGQLCDSKK